MLNFSFSSSFLANVWLSEHLLGLFLSWIAVGQWIFHWVVVLAAFIGDAGHAAPILLSFLSFPFFFFLLFRLPFGDILGGLGAEGWWLCVGNELPSVGLGGGAR